MPSKKLVIEQGTHSGVTGWFTYVPGDFWATARPHSTWSAAVAYAHEASDG